MLSRTTVQLRTGDVAADKGPAEEVGGEVSAQLADDVSDTVRGRQVAHVTFHQHRHVAQDSLAVQKQRRVREGERRKEGGSGGEG